MEEVLQSEKGIIISMAAVPQLPLFFYLSKKFKPLG